jgi:hypothetical protein
MIQPHDPVATHSEEPDAVSVDEAILDRYAGLYQVSEWNVLARRGCELSYAQTVSSRVPYSM